MPTVVKPLEDRDLTGEHAPADFVLAATAHERFLETRQEPTQAPGQSPLYRCSCRGSPYMW
jgi:hypothetical protein